MDEKTYLSLPEVSHIMNKSVQTLRRLIKKGDLNAKRIKTPQGFHYVVHPDTLAEIGYGSSPKPMFYNSPIQNTIIPQEEALEDVAPYQVENLYRRTELEPQEEADYYPLDIQEPKMLRDTNINADSARREHDEKMFFYSIIERLQNDLRLEKEKGNVFARTFKRLCNRIILAIKGHSF
ncbi:helix-turn-helix domain-containing protein [Candidatus Peregrinibacteria bacterium]|nr:helix-turn-helix domain-containing protein [Candidatus Peregrinibacteria bacterium]